MPTEVKAPALGESISEIYVGKWYKQPGDKVAKDEPLVELESDKATLDLPAAEPGTLTEILKPSGSTVEVGETLAVIEKGEAPATPQPAPAVAAQRETQPKESPPADAQIEKPRSDAPLEPMTSYSDIAGPVAGADREVSEPERRHPADKGQEQPKPEQPPASPPRMIDRSTEFQQDITATSKQEAHRLAERVPMSPLRRRIAIRLVEAQQQAALLTTFNEADMTAIKELRTELGEAFQKKHGVRLGFMSFFVKAAVAALEQYPQLNAIIEENDIVYRRFFDIGIAVSTDKGLVVPVLRNAERMGFAEIEHSIEAYAAKARDGELKVEDLQGGTFTITNGGIFGSLLSTPIINPPQSGVLGMHAIQDRPVAENGQVVIRPMMYLALTYDHRMVDGREAVMFLRQIKQGIESPSRLLLEV